MAAHLASLQPPLDATAAALAGGLSLAGRPLAPPRFHATDWREMQRFTAEDDPDRTQEPWKPPAFVFRTDPKVQREKIVVEELFVGEAAASSTASFARVLRHVMDEEDCVELLASVNQKGFTPALINIGGGRQQLIPELRDGHRVIVDSPELANWLLEVLRPHLPAQHEGAQLVDLNERCRFLCYTPGQAFAPHRDGRYSRPKEQPNAGDFSLITIQLYLHDVPAENGGATAFLGHGKTECQPGAGSALIFTQDLLHEGALVTAGLKYTLRTEAMYRGITPRWSGFLRRLRR